jgi:multiple sugar transport system substrate-binding protein
MVPIPEIHIPLPLTIQLSALIPTNLFYIRNDFTGGRRMFIKRMLCIIMAAMVMLSLAACGGTTAPAATTAAATTVAATAVAATAVAATTVAEAETTAVTTEEPTREAPKPIKWMLFQWGTGQNLDDPNLKYYQALNEWANVIIEPIIVPFDTYTDKFNATFASGDVPDLVCAVGMLALVNENLGPAGLVVPISDHLDKLPSYKKYLDKYKSQLPKITATDGKMYEVVLINDSKAASDGLMMREDILKAGNFDPASIKTTDDLYAAFKVLQEQNDGKPVLNCRYGFSRMEFFANIFGGGFSIRWNPDTKVWYQSAITDNTKAGVTFLAKLFKEGILAKDWASNTDELWESAFRTGRLYSSYDNLMQLSAMTLAEGQKMIYIVPPTYNGVRYPRPYGGGLDSWMGNVINSKSKAIDNILAMQEFLFNDANQTFIQYGEEGVTFVTRSDGTKAYKEGMFWWADPVNPLSEVYGCGWQESTCFLVPFERTFVEYVKENDLTQSPWIPAYNAYAEAVWTYQEPVYAFTKEELDILNNLRPALETYISEAITQFISNVKPLSEWDAFVQGVKDLSSDQVVEIQNTATTRTNK